MVSPMSSSSSLREVLPGSSLARSHPTASPQWPSTVPTPREPVGNYRKGTSVPPSPRSVSREASGDDKAVYVGTSTGKSESPEAPGKTRSSAPVSRESSGSDLEDSVGAPSDEKGAPLQSPRQRSSSQRNLTQPPAPRRLTSHVRANTMGTSTTPSNSPEKGSPGKSVEGGQPEKQQ
jgi:hypothetical protein